MKLLVSAVLVAACVQPMAACDLCAIYSASQARGEVGEGSFAGVSEQFTHFGTMQEDGHRVSNPSGQYMDSWISQIYAGYNFSERIGVQFNLPVIYRSFKRPDSAGGIDRGSESGIGDVSLLGTFVPYQKLDENFTFKWGVLAGIKFPTGDSHRISEELNEVEDPVGPPSGIHGHDLAMGTGSYDGIVGTGIYLRWHKAFLAVNTQYAIRSTGDFDYRYADDLTWSGGPGYYLLLQHEYTLSLQAIVSGEYKWKDTFQGESAEDTAVTAVYLGPQLNFTWGEHLAIYVAGDLPVSIQNTSFQAVPDYRIRGGITWHF